MKANEVLNVPLGEKVYVTELYHDRSSDLIAVGLKTSVFIYQLNFGDSENEKPSSSMIKAVSNADHLDKCVKNTYVYLFEIYSRLIMMRPFTVWLGLQKLPWLWHQEN